MGYGSYTARDWEKLKKSKKIDSSSTSQIFSQTEMNPKYDPKFVNKREARDSELHPMSTPIMIGVDVTGSMGYLSTQIIKESLNELMQMLYSTQIIRDPQLLFAAIGDAEFDKAPLQVTQFESDIRIAEQLMDLWLENSGGDLEEDYELLWYFAAKHTETDSFNKRGEKGFCFSIGDAPMKTELSGESVTKVFDDKDAKDYTSYELMEMANEKYELFHIMIGERIGNFEEYIPGRVIRIAKSEVKHLPAIIISAIRFAKGEDMKKVLEQWDILERRVVEKSLMNLCVKKNNKISF